MSSKPSSSLGAAFEKTLQGAVQACIAAKTDDPVAFVAAWLSDAATRAGTKTHVLRLDARQILDSRGTPTVQVDVWCVDPGRGTSVLVARGNAPSGASTGSHEALELRDKDPKVYFGKGVLGALANVRGALTRAVVGKDVTALVELDQALCDADGTEFKSQLGGNAITAASFALARAGARIRALEPFQFFAEHFSALTGRKSAPALPVMMANLINGGKHASGDLMIQEFMVVPTRKVAYRVRLQWVAEVYQALKQILKSRYGGPAVHLGDEGGFAPPVNTGHEALTALEEAVTAAGLRVGKDMYFALDCAASEFYDADTAKYQVEKGSWLTSAELVDYYARLVEQHPALVSIEDSHHETDYEGWKAMTARLGKQVLLVGDDLYTTNPTFIRRGIAEQWATALLLKVNQIGTVCESMRSAHMQFEAGGSVVVSHRSGETTSDLIADLAVGIGAQYIKTGAPARGERTAKYNRLLQIEDYLLATGALSYTPADLCPED